MILSQRFAHLFRFFAQIEQNQFGGSRLRNYLTRPAILRNKICAQSLVSRHERIQSVSQGREFQLAAQSHGSTDVVERTVWFKLIDEPHSFLGKRQWSFNVGRNLLDSIAVQAMGFSPLFLDALR